MIRLWFISILTCALGIQGFAQTIYELTDKKNIVFARNLRDWQLNPVDSLMFDIYYPTGAMSNKKYPVYLSLHGGSFVTATKQSVTEFSDEFADKGFIVIAPDYRVGYPGSGQGSICTGGDDSTGLQGAIYRAMQDANACVRFIANHANEFNIDTSAIFLGGASAGGTLSLNMAYVTDSAAAIHFPDLVAEWGGLQNSGNNEPYRYRLKGLAPMWGVMPYWDGLINSHSAIPTILFKGGKDVNIPNGIGYYLKCSSNSMVRAGSGVYDVMVALRVPAVFHFQPNTGHAAYDNDFCVDQIACFFDGLIKKQPYSGYFQVFDSSCPQP